MCRGTSPGPAYPAGARHCASGVFRRPSPHPSGGSRATCVYVSWPVGLYNSGNALLAPGLLAGHGAGTIMMNHSPWVGHCHEVA